MSGTPADVGLLILRLGTSSMMAMHGFGKVSDLFEGNHGFADPLGIGELPSLILAAFSEFLFAILVGLGVKVRVCAVPVAITMLVAAFVHHRDDSFDQKELALLYAIPYLTLALTGGGCYTLESLIRRKR